MVHAPRPYSPASKYVRQECIGWDSPYGTIISAHDARCRTGRPSKRTSCSTRPSCGSIAARSVQRCHVISLPSTVKLTPSGCVMLERPQVVARGHRPGRIGAVGLQRNRLDVHLLELEHAALVDVHVGDQALDRVRVAVFARPSSRYATARATRRPRSTSSPKPPEARTSICTSETSSTPRRRSASRQPASAAPPRRPPRSPRALWVSARRAGRARRRAPRRRDRTPARARSARDRRRSRVHGGAAARRLPATPDTRPWAARAGRSRRSADRRAGRARSAAARSSSAGASGSSGWVVTCWVAMRRR